MEDFELKIKDRILVVLAISLGLILIALIF
jgi:hypothetical protein